MKSKSNCKGENTMSTTATTNSVTAIDSKKPTTKQELIAANIKLLIEQLEGGHSEALTNYLTAMSRFHNYSFGNVLEIARQMPTATRVAGFWTWKNLGRSVKAGQKGIRILAPIIGVRRKKQEEAEKDITKQNERVLLGFRNAYVFDVSQTDGVELPEMREISGDPGENLERLASFVRSRGITLGYNPNIAPALGMSYGGRIVLAPGQSKAEEFSTLVHEAAHELLHKAERRTATTKTVRETEAEAVAFVVGKAVGLVTGSASADYIQLYHGNASLLAESLEVIQQTASIILSALEPPITEEVATDELAEVAA
jgi:N-terminal domain of anti-restriction factor ArdC